MASLCRDSTKSVGLAKCFMVTGKNHLPRALAFVSTGKNHLPSAFSTNGKNLTSGEIGAARHATPKYGRSRQPANAVFKVSRRGEV